MLISSLFLTALGYAADPPLPRDVEEVLGMARSLPAEFAADVLLRVSEHPSLARTKRRSEILEDALVLASRAREPVARIALPGVAPESAEAVEAAAFGLGLDALSLQTRAIRLSERVDWLDRLPVNLALPNTCGDRLVADTSVYWTLMGELLKAENPPDLRPLTSAVEIAPAVEMIESIAPGKERLEALSGRLIDGVERISGDDRAFSVSVQRASRSLETLAIIRVREGLPAAPVLNALAGFLKRHMMADRCADTLDTTQSAVLGFVGYFNSNLRRAGHLSAAELTPIRDEETTPQSVTRVESKTAEWLEAYRKLSGADAIADSPLQNEKPLVWFLAARTVEDPRSRNLIIATYARLRALKL